MKRWRKPPLFGLNNNLPSIAVSRSLTSGTKVGTITLNGKSYDLYCQTNSDTKNTAGTSNKTATKLFLAGATSQGANPQTYSNAGCYIGSDNELYSNGERVAHSDWVQIESNINVYPSAKDTLVTVTTKIPSTAKEVLLFHNTLGEVHFTRVTGAFKNGYYGNEYYNMFAWFEWTSQSTVKFKITDIGSSENFSSHGVKAVWYR